MNELSTHVDMIIGGLPSNLDSNGQIQISTTEACPDKTSKTYWRSVKLLAVTGIKRTKELEALNYHFDNAASKGSPNIRYALACREELSRRFMQMNSDQKLGLPA